MLIRLLLDKAYNVITNKNVKWDLCKHEKLTLTSLIKREIRTKYKKELNEDMNELLVDIPVILEFINEIGENLNEKVFNIAWKTELDVSCKINDSILDFTVSDDEFNSL